MLKHQKNTVQPVSGNNLENITTINGIKVTPHTQKMYKVGFGPNLWGIISEDSLDKYSNIVGIEEYGTRTVYYIKQETEIHYLEE